MTDILPENINLQFLAEQQARILSELDRLRTEQHHIRTEQHEMRTEQHQMRQELAQVYNGQHEIAARLPRLAETCGMSKKRSRLSSTTSAGLKCASSASSGTRGSCGPSARLAPIRAFSGAAID